ncbi:universal stress protein [Actinoplanes sp. L3-i22]|uniref:universal stress protein n=1 Tax=Actinoplanes sp. L3-i22 TaxID=2836373 RepID=UPI001C763E19|nr:universal stress protein [Actinoplanes sp. L3-i22]BCY09393.1 universal stress protein [Actinoplanes sp. L3-i22]
MLKKIIIGYDGSPLARAALDWTLDEADRTHCPVELFYADEWPAWTPTGGASSGPDRPDSYAVEVIGGMMERALATARQTHPMVDVTTKTVRAFPGPALIDRSRRARLIVVGGRGHSAVADLLGSVSSAVSAHAHCPVVVIRGAASSNARVVAGIDGSALATPVLDFAAAQASARRVPLRVVQAWPLAQARDRERDRLDSLVIETRDTFPEITVESEAIVEHPAAALVRESAAAQLVVVGSRGRNVVQGLLLGSVSQHLLRHSSCTVAVVHDTLMRA